MGVTARASGASSPSSILGEHLDAVAALDAATFHPGRALTAMRSLMELPEAERMPFLLGYARSRVEVPSGVFAVVRALIEVPGRDQPAADFPEVLQPGYLRPPALGAPDPPAPDDPTELPRFPVVLLEDVPLVLVSGYALGGKPESLAMHLEGLEGARWRSKPLAPTSAGSVRYLLEHWGRFADDARLSAQLTGQLARYEAG